MPNARGRSWTRTENDVHALIRSTAFRACGFRVGQIAETISARMRSASSAEPLISSTRKRFMIALR